PPPAPQRAVDQLEEQHAHRGVDARAQQQVERRQPGDPHVERGGESGEDEPVQEAGHEQHQRARRRLGEVEPGAGHAHSVAQHHAGEAGEAQYLTAELDVLHPAAQRADQHALGLAALQAVVDHHQKEGGEDAGLRGQHARERRLQQQRGQQGQRDAEGLHLPGSSTRASGGGVRTTMTSSSLSKSADAVTRTSLNRPLPPRTTVRTRPMTRPGGNMRSRPEVTTTSPSTTSASTGHTLTTRSPPAASSVADWREICAETWPDTTPVTRLRSMRAPTPLCWSSSSCTWAAEGPTRITRPTTPVGLITAASLLTPWRVPLSMVRMRNHCMASRTTTWATSVSWGRIWRSSSRSRSRTVSSASRWRS